VLLDDLHLLTVVDQNFQIDPLAGLLQAFLQEDSGFGYRVVLVGGADVGEF
jgi:hypothetical protein